MQIKIIVPSRRRSDSIAKHTLALFPDATICIAESEEKNYARVTKNLLLHPDSLQGIGPKRQWMLDNVKEEVVFQVDDDVINLFDNTGLRSVKITDPDKLMAIIERMAIACNDAGAKLFGFSASTRLMWYKPQTPISLRHQCGSMCGVIGRTVCYDKMFKSWAEDIDFALSNILKHKIIWIDTRYSFNARRWGGDGGNDINRSAAREIEEKKYLKSKWGKYVSFEDGKKVNFVKLNIPK